MVIKSVYKTGEEAAHTNWIMLDIVEETKMSSRLGTASIHNSVFTLGVPMQCGGRGLGWDGSLHIVRVFLCLHH